MILVSSDHWFDARTGLSPLPCGSCTLHQESVDANLRTGAATHNSASRKMAQDLSMY
jgi:hypothetical protein